MRNLASSLCLLLAALGSPALAQSVPGGTPVATDSRVKTFVYNENDVYNLLTYYGFQSNVEFGPKERIETVSIGDRAGWQVVPAGRRLFLRAVADNLHTNMTVVTNEHAYQFDLRATDPASVPQEELVYVIRFYYPDDPKNQRATAAPLVVAPAAPVAYPTNAASSPAQPPLNAPATTAPLVEPAPQPAPMVETPIAAAPVPTAPAFAPVAKTKPILAAPASTAAPAASNRYGAGPFDTPLAASSTPAAPTAPTATTLAGKNYNYTYTGAGQVLPTTIFDDGQRTYMQFADNTHPPRIIAADHGVAQPQKTTLEGQYVVVPLVAKRLLLQAGGQSATIYNEARP